MIKFTNVSMTYPTGTKALKNIDLTINDGEFVFIIGPNGAGKTTLTKLLLGEEKPTEGTLEVNGYNLNKIKKRQMPQYRRTLGFVFQDNRLFQNLSVYDNVAFAMHVVNEPGKRVEKRTSLFLDLVNLGDKMDSAPGMLSGGEQRRVALARALVNNPDIIIADEPTSNSDELMAQGMMELLKKVNRDPKYPKTVIVISHDMKIVEDYQIQHNARVLTLVDGVLTEGYTKLEVGKNE